MSTGDPESFVEGTPIQEERLGAIATHQTSSPAIPTNPAEMLYLAMSQGRGMEELKQFMDLKDRWEAKEAEKAYYKAFAAFKSEAVQIIKNVTVTDGPLKNSKYADLSAAVDAATPALSKYGLSSAWKLTKDEPQWLEVTCVLRHELGFSEVVSMGGPPDTGGAKNALQARGSTKSYLEKYTFMAITGLAAKGQDADGNAPIQRDPEVEQDLSAAMAQIAEAKDKASLTKIFNAAYAKTTDRAAKDDLLTAQKKRLAELK